MRHLKKQSKRLKKKKTPTNWQILSAKLKVPEEEEREGTKGRGNPMDNGEGLLVTLVVGMV